VNQEIAQTKPAFYSLEGRLNREPFIGWTLSLCLSSGFLSLLASMAFNAAQRIQDPGMDFIAYLLTAGAVGTGISTLFPVMKRLHDIDLSAGWVLVALIPFVGLLFLIVLAILPGSGSANRFGPEPRRKAPILDAQEALPRPPFQRAPLDAERDLLKLRELRERQLISEAVYLEKQKEILNRF
jgi:uncharacterized membrane protein YhaH (DUF805 family)